MRRAANALLGLGIDAETPLDVAIALRNVNLSAAGMVLVSVGAAIGSLVDAHSPLLAIGCLTLGLAYASCLLLSATGRPLVARWVFLATACLHYVQFNIAIGRAGGAPFYMVGMLVFQVGAFTRAERQSGLLVYVILAATFVVGEVLGRRYGPLIALTTPDIAYFFTLLSLCTIVGAGLHYYKNGAFAAQEQLRAARERISDLLENMLPSSIVARLERGEHLIADSHGDASVLFADLTGFSSLTRRLAPTHLVEVLNRIFSRFDAAAERHGIEKIKTIGDCYMAATGVLNEPTDVPDADAMAELALELPVIVEQVSRELGLPLGVRVGMSTGAVVSGVIGTRRSVFDVWGDTVNLASQLEATGIVGHVQVSEATYWRLRERYVFESRGDVDIKGGQRVPTYLLVGRGAPHAAEAV